jgi:ATP-dependent DNA helicase RecG
MTLADLIAGGESLTVEFKKDANDHDLVEAVVCLANAQGGTLLVGVDDDGRVVGARPRHGATTDPRRIEALVSNSTRPSIGVRAELETLGGKAVLVLHVPRATIPTATSTGRYLRRALGGDGKPACVPLFVFETAGSGLAQDPSAAVVPNATFNDLDPLEIERFRRLVRESGGRGDAALLSLADDELCRALGGFEPNGRAPAIQRVALLLFGREDSLGRLLPTHEVAWQVIEGDKVRENEIHRLPLLRSFETLTEKFRARNRSTEIVDLFRTEIPDFSEEAFREAVANAMTHRDYTALGAIHVQWTEEAQGLEPRRAARGGAARQPPHHHAAPEESLARRRLQASRHRRAHRTRHRRHLLRSGALRATAAALRRHVHFRLALLARQRRQPRLCPLARL